MAKPLGFKDFLAVDYTPGEDPQVSRNAAKRKKSLDRGVNDEVEKEELSFSARRALGRNMKKNKAKLKIGRDKAARRTAGMPKLKQRASKQVRNNLFKLFSKGKSRSDVAMSRRQEIEKRINKLPASRINNLVRKLLPKVRQDEKDRKNKNAEKSDKK